MFLAAQVKLFSSNLVHLNDNVKDGCGLFHLNGNVVKRIGLDYRLHAITTLNVY